MATDNDRLYEEAISANGAALGRLVIGYEADPDRRRDLMQEIHIERWRSLRLFDGRCSVRTWVYRVAHNVAATHIMRARRASRRLIDLEALESEPAFIDGEEQANRRHLVSLLLDRIRRLKPLDREVMLYLEGETASAIAEVAGLTEGNIATKIHRIKRVLKRESGVEGIDAGR